MVGIDVDAKDARVSWQSYLELFCMFEEGSVPLDRLARLWTNFFDIDHNGECRERDYMTLLEQMVRGNTMGQPS